MPWRQDACGGLGHRRSEENGNVKVGRTLATLEPKPIIIVACL